MLGAAEVASLFGCSTSTARRRMRAAGAGRDGRGRLVVDAGALRELALQRVAGALAGWGFHPDEVIAALPEPAERWVTVTEAARVLHRRRSDVIRASRGLEWRGSGRKGDPRRYRLTDLAAAAQRAHGTLGRT